MTKKTSESPSVVGTESWGKAFRSRHADRRARHQQHTTHKEQIRPSLPWPMSEGKQQILQQREIETPTISGERISPNPSAESTVDRSGIDFQSHRGPPGVLVEAYERALPKRGGLVPEHVLREFCQFLVSFSVNLVLGEFLLLMLFYPFPLRDY